MVAAHRAGLDVARLASGDLSVFSRARRADAPARRRGRALRPVPGRAGLRRGGRGAGPGADGADGRPDCHPDENLRAGHPDAGRRGPGGAGPLGAARWCCTCRCTGSTRWSPALGVYGRTARPPSSRTPPTRTRSCCAAGSTRCPPRCTRPGIRMAAVVIVGPALAAEHFPDSHLYSDARCRS